MRRNIIIVNNFYKNPEEVVKYALSLKFYNPWANNNKGSSKPEDMTNPVLRVSFFKKAQDCPFKSSKEFISKLEKITGEEIDMEHWNKDFPENPEDGSVLTLRPDLIDPSEISTSGQYKMPAFNNLKPGATSCRWNCAFQVKHLQHESGTFVHDHDQDLWNSIGQKGWTGIVYLNPDAPLGAGLTTYRSADGGAYKHSAPKEYWDVIDNFANVYNRLLLIRGTVPHVGGSGWGDSLRNGRLYQTFFFKSIKPEDTEEFSFRL